MAPLHTTLDATCSIEHVSRLRKVATCSCGWQSRERYSSGLLTAQWEEHAADVHGAPPQHD